MAQTRLEAELLISAGVKGVEHIARASDALGDMGEKTASIKAEAERLKNEWDKLSPNEQARRLKSLADSYNKAAEDNAKLNAESAKSTSLFAKMRSELGLLAGALAGAFALNKMSSFMASAVQIGASLEEQLSKVQAVSGATADEMAKIEARAKELGAATRYTATEAAEGFEILARAGLNAQEQLIAIPDVLALAQGAGIGLADSASYITRAVRGMNLSISEAGRVADVLARAAASANTDVTGLGNALSYAAPSAASLGLSLEETVAIIGKFADAGIDASRAGTALNSILSQFSNPASTFRRALSDVGITTSDFSEALVQMAEKGEEAHTAIIAVGQEAGPALKALLAQGMPALEELRNKLNDAQGAAQSMAEVMDDNLPGAVRGLSSAWEGLKIALAQPMLDPIKGQVNDLSKVVRDLVANGSIDKLGQALAQFATWGGKGLSVLIRFAPVLAAFASAMLAARAAIAAKSLALSVYAARANLATAALTKLRAASASLVNVGLAAAIYAASAAYKALKSDVDAVVESAKENAEAFAEIEKKIYELKTAQEAFVNISDELRDGNIRALEEEREAIEARIRAYEDQITQAERRLFTDEKTIETALFYIEVEKERKARIEETLESSKAFIEAEKARIAEEEKSQAVKKATIEGWEKLSKTFVNVEKEASQIPERSQELIDALRLLSEEGENSGEKLRLAFSSAFLQAETREAIEKMKHMMRQAFADGKLDAEQYAYALAQANAQQEKLPAAITQTAMAMRALGIDATTFTNEMSHSAYETLQHFQMAAQEYGTTQEKLTQIYQAAAEKMQNPAQLEALKEALFEVGTQAGFAQQEIEAIALSSVESTSAATLAFKKMGVDIQEALTGISSKNQTMLDDFINAFQTAAEEGLNLKKITQAAFETMFAQSGSVEELKALQNSLKEVGAYALLSSEQQTRLKDALLEVSGAAQTQIISSEALRTAYQQETGDVNRLTSSLQALKKARDESEKGEKSTADATMRSAEASEKEAKATEKRRRSTKSYGTSAASANNMATRSAEESARASQEAARQMEAMSNSAKKTVSGLQEELMRLRGESEKLAKFQQQQKEAELKSKANDALASGNVEAYREYQKALQLQKQIYAEQRNQARNEGKEKNAMPATSDDKVETKAAAQEVAQAFAGYTDAQMQEAKRQARNELMNELKDSAMRLSR